ncbi:hypothetical protein [Clostridium intestinale]|uniref:hypothetical protein n=1 Tax=Clostridium intestinale TaxID=36845 RepID=UPI002DD698AC|nr:hypothetical protein [Clostridium intestinale]WRY53932.1 hypothetical protein P8F83_12130 [Clostridium intestinale]
MKSFKECLVEDSKVFFNNNEFSEKHNINGRLLNIVVDNNQLMNRSKIEYEGVMVGDILYYVTSEDYGKAPKVDEVQMYDNIPCKVFDVRIDSGMYEIILKRSTN